MESCMDKDFCIRTRWARSRSTGFRNPKGVIACMILEHFVLYTTVYISMYVVNNCISNSNNEIKLIQPLRLYTETKTID